MLFLLIVVLVMCLGLGSVLASLTPPLYNWSSSK